MNTLSSMLLQSHGPLMSSAEAAAALKFASTNAMRMALRRRQLQLRPIALPGRRGRYFATEEVARMLETWLSVAGPGKQEGEIDM